MCATCLPEHDAALAWWPGSVQGKLSSSTAEQSRGKLAVKRIGSSAPFYRERRPEEDLVLQHGVVQVRGPKANCVLQTSLLQSAGSTMTSAEPGASSMFRA